jgi:hypothetical protein
MTSAAQYEIARQLARIATALERISDAPPTIKTHQMMIDTIMAICNCDPTAAARAVNAIRPMEYGNDAQ